VALSRPVERALEDLCRALAPRRNLAGAADHQRAPSLFVELSDRGERPAGADVEAWFRGRRWGRRDSTALARLAEDVAFIREGRRPWWSARVVKSWFTES
jgi:hypothetical protein